MKKKDNDKTNEILPAVSGSLTDKPLTEEEDKFCELYVSGGPLYAGNHRKCYEEVFGKGKNVPIASRLLLGRPHISARIREMIDSVQFDVETIATRLQVAETLKAVMSETSSAEYTDKFGVPLSPDRCVPWPSMPPKPSWNFIPSSARRRPNSASTAVRAA